MNQYTWHGTYRWLFGLVHQVFEGIEFMRLERAEYEIENSFSAISGSLVWRFRFGDVLGRLDSWSIL